MRHKRGASPRKKPAFKKGAGVLKRAPVSKAGQVSREFQRKYGFSPRVFKGEILLTPGQQRKVFAVRRAALVQRKARAEAKAAVAAYKPRKKDFGKVVLVGAGGKADPQKKGRKGYAVYISSTGKKSFLKQAAAQNPYAPRKLRDQQLPLRKNLHRRVAEFQKRRGKVLGHARVTEAGREAKAVKQVEKAGVTGDAAARLVDFKLSGAGKGRFKVDTGGAWDFNDAAVRKIAQHIRGVIKAQRGQRAFLIQAMVLIELQDKSREVVEFTVDIARNDSDAIRLGGIENFVRLKFYAFMARELAFMGLVSSGSNNHIRRLSDNQGATEGELVDSRGQLWAGNELQVCRIITIEYRIIQG